MSRFPLSRLPWPLPHRPGKGCKNWPSPRRLPIQSLRNPRMIPSWPPILEIQLVFLDWLGGKWTAILKEI